MKKYYLTAFCVCAAILLAASFIFDYWHPTEEISVLNIGILYDNDESTPYTYNFSLVNNALESQYGERVHVLTKSNIVEDEWDVPCKELIEQGCQLIFTNSYSDLVIRMASLYPEIQFCQVSYQPEQPKVTPDNYHTFKGTVDQGRYISGIAAGMKLKQLIDSGAVKKDQALVGYIAAFPSAEVMSGFTAFLLGIHQVVPEATMRVIYTGTWSNYTLEKSDTKELIRQGCVIIGQHTDTIGPAMACEEMLSHFRAYHVGYNQSMIDQAPSTSLISTCIDWRPYVLAATDAVFHHASIEKTVHATSVWGHDMSAGFDKGWVDMLDLNESIAAPGTAERIQAEIETFQREHRMIFKGNYIGVNPDDPSDTVDLNQGYQEYLAASSPAFHYLLKDYITVVAP